MSNDTTFQIRRPDRIQEALHRECTVLLTAVANCSADIAAATAAGAATDGVRGAVAAGAVAAFASRTLLIEALRKHATLDPSELGWVLCYRSMCKAVSQLYSDLDFESHGGMTADAAGVTSQHIDQTLSESEVRITSAFFDHPASDFCHRMRQALELELNRHGFSPVSVSQVSGRLNVYFASALRIEFRTHSKDYAPLLEATSTPFDGVFERRYKLNEYYDWLTRKTYEPLFDESFSLEDVYISLRAYHFSAKPTANSPAVEALRPEHDSDDSARNICVLEDYLEHWILTQVDSYDYKDAIRIVSGGPGSGKSTSVRRFAARIARQLSGIEVLYIPLHLFSFGDDLSSAVSTFCEYHEPPLPADVLAAHNPLQLLIVFDGLDELAKQGDVGAEAAKAFADHLLTWISRYGDKRRLSAILCGRPVAAGRASVRGIRSEQTLYLLSYFEPSLVRRQGSQLVADVGIHDPLGLLPVDQRIDWWKKYGTAKGRDYKGIPPELVNKGDELDDVTAQPLLNYLVALTYERSQSGLSKIDFRGAVNVNAVYADMLNGIWARRYEKQHKSTVGFDKVAYECLLEDIALTAWHGSGRAATIEQVQAGLDSRRAQQLVGMAGEVRSGIMRLFLGFYIQSRKVATGTEVFEFTHKSFGEYLSARRMLAALKTCSEEYERYKTGSRSGGRDIDECLLELLKTFGPSRLDNDINKFIRREMDVEDEAGSKKIATSELIAWRGFVIELIKRTHSHGIPAERLPGGATFRTMERATIATEEAMLALHHNLSLTLHARGEDVIPAKFNWASLDSAGTWIRKLVGQRINGDNMVASLSLGWIDFSGQCFHMMDFYDADLRHSVMVEIKAYSGNFELAILHGVSFASAYLPGALFVKPNSVHPETIGFLGGRMNGVSFAKARLDGARIHEGQIDEATKTAPVKGNKMHIVKYSQPRKMK